MLILAVDTTAGAASCALWKDGYSIAESFINAKITHSVTLMPMIESMFSSVGADIADVEMLAATVGPGSFTGVRIGASVILGLACGRNIPCVGVSTLDVLALTLADVPGDFMICPVMDARRGQFYNALFRSGHAPQRLTEDRAVSGEQIAEELKKYGLPVMANGDGYRVFEPFLKDIPVLKTPDKLIYQSASKVAEAAYNKYEEAENKSVFTDLNFKPVYLRPSQAERTLKEKNDPKGE
jgi:tRNA threonylcarbamoyladenosine biosynthesis protein TsaB